MPKIKKKITEYWQNWITQTPQLASQLNKPFINIYLHKPWFSAYKQSNRQCITLLNRSRSQHVTTKVHLHKIQLSNTPFCDCSTTIIEEPYISMPITYQRSQAII